MRTMNVNKTGVVTAMLVALSGCAAMPGTPPGLREVGMERADVPPRKDWVEGQRVKVVVGAPEGDWPAARQAQLVPLLSQAVQQAIEESGSEVVDRSLNTSLKNEMRLAEARGSGNFDGPAVAHFAVRPGFSKVSVNSIREERGMLSKLIKKNEPPTYDHRLVVEGRIRVYEIPSMRLVETLQFKEEHKEENTSPQMPDANAKLREAFEKAYGRVRGDFRNLIAPRGAIVKKGIAEGGTFFQAMMGRDHKLTPRAKVKIYSYRGGQETLVAEASVSKYIAAHSCWISVDDAKAVGRIREGDIARLAIDESMLGKLKVW
ncbi:MAG: hypothetical protein OEW21_19285 [Betaproteobacteria bacterium]|nr:hypothetical protein [Betaproteobacteria bacterium]